FSAYFLGYTRHRVEACGTAHVEPVPKLLNAHPALHLWYLNLSERRSKLSARLADQRGPVRGHVALQRCLLDKCRDNRSCGCKIDAHTVQCRQTTVITKHRLRAAGIPWWRWSIAAFQGYRVIRSSLNITDARRG